MKCEAESEVSTSEQEVIVIVLQIQRIWKWILYLDSIESSLTVKSDTRCPLSFRDMLVNFFSEDFVDDVKRDSDKLTL